MHLDDNELELLKWVSTNDDLNGLKQNGKRPQNLLAIVLLGGDGSSTDTEKRILFEKAIDKQNELYKQKRKFRSSGSQDTSNKKRCRKYTEIVESNKGVASIFAKLIKNGTAKPTGHCDPLIKLLKAYDTSKNTFGLKVPALDERAISIVFKFASDNPKLQGYEYLKHLCDVVGFKTNKA